MLDFPKFLPAKAPPPLFSRRLPPPPPTPPHTTPPQVHDKTRHCESRNTGRPARCESRRLNAKSPQAGSFVRVSPIFSLTSPPPAEIAATPCEVWWMSHVPLAPPRSASMSRNTAEHETSTKLFKVRRRCDFHENVGEPRANGLLAATLCRRLPLSHRAVHWPSSKPCKNANNASIQSILGTERNDWLRTSTCTETRKRW